jgi:hypothetical protein
MNTLKAAGLFLLAAVMLALAVVLGYYHAALKFKLWEFLSSQ